MTEGTGLIELGGDGFCGSEFGELSSWDGDRIGWSCVGAEICELFRSMVVGRGEYLIHLK